MIADGYAHEYTYAVPYRYQSQFVAAERAARAGDRGSGRRRRARATRRARRPSARSSTTAVTGNRPGCDPAYPGVCIPPSPPDLDCADVTFRRFRVLSPDPHRFDLNHDGVGCES